MADELLFNCNPLGIGHDNSRFGTGLSLRPSAAYNGAKLKRNDIPSLTRNCGRETGQPGHQG